jgi:hypothetical protein
MLSKRLLVVFSLFGAGGALFIAGMAAQMSALLYSSGAVSGAGLFLSIYLFVKERPKIYVFESPLFPPRIYNEPSMKKNKSDTNLELMGGPKTTTDDGANDAGV